MGAPDPSTAGFCGIGHLQPSRGWRLPGHAHGFHEMIVVLSGRMEVSIAGRTHRGGPGDVLWYPAGVEHREWAVGDEERRQAVILPGGATATLVELRLLPEAHPGMANLAQRHLLVPLGDAKAGLLAISASGSHEAIAAIDPQLRAVFASVTTPQR